MSLETGRYIIKNGDKIVGRALAEDLSLNPKRIILVSSDNESTVRLCNNLCLISSLTFIPYIVDY